MTGCNILYEDILIDSEYRQHEYRFYGKVMDDIMLISIFVYLYNGKTFQIRSALKSIRDFHVKYGGQTISGPAVYDMFKRKCSSFFIRHAKRVGRGKYRLSYTYKKSEKG